MKILDEYLRRFPSVRVSSLIFVNKFEREQTDSNLSSEDVEDLRDFLSRRRHIDSLHLDLDSVQSIR